MRSVPFAFALLFAVPTACVPTGLEGVNPGECSDQLDNDGNGSTDCGDSGCGQAADCSGSDTDTDTDRDTGTDTDTGTETDTSNDTGTGNDSGDSADTDTVPTFEIYKLDAGQWDITGSCDTSACDYTVTTTAEAGLVELDMTQTGNPYKYREYHDEFVLDSINADGSETYLLHLEIVTDPADVGPGTTVLDAEELDVVTWLFGAYSSNMAVYDCVVTGESSTYYAAECPNFW